MALTQVLAVHTVPVTVLLSGSRSSATVLLQPVPQSVILHLAGSRFQAAAQASVEDVQGQPHWSEINYLSWFYITFLFLPC